MSDMDQAVNTVAGIFVLQQRIAALEAENQRLRDLVRYARHMLFDDDLIDKDEYAALVADDESGERVARLAGYDKLRAEIAELRKDRALQEIADRKCEEVGRTPAAIAREALAK